MGLNGTLCFLNHMKSTQSSYSFLEFVHALFYAWPNLTGRIIHQDIYVRRYIVNLIVALLELSPKHGAVYNDDSGYATLIDPWRHPWQEYEDNHHTIDLHLAPSARSMIHLMEELDQTPSLCADMKEIGDRLFVQYSN